MHQLIGKSISFFTGPLHIQTVVLQTSSILPYLCFTLDANLGMEGCRLVLNQPWMPSPVERDIQLHFNQVVSRTPTIAEILSHMGVSKNMGTPKWMVYNGKPYHNGWFGGTPIFGNIHMLHGTGIFAHITIDLNQMWVSIPSGFGSLFSFASDLFSGFMLRDYTWWTRAKSLFCSRRSSWLSVLPRKHQNIHPEN